MNEAALKVIEGVDLQGDVNTPDDQIRANIEHSIRLQHPQVWQYMSQPQVVCLVGGGPSLSSTEAELRELYFSGAMIVTLNGAYHWCIERNIKPTAQIVLDARAENARFVSPAVHGCKYLLASQCHPDIWAAVDGRPFVWIWHAISDQNERRDILDAYYQGRWQGIAGGTTVAMRALVLLRTLGYLRFHMFGIDSCWLGDAHHAYSQPENDRDRRQQVRVQPCGHPELARQFWCDPWHLKQLEDFLQLVRTQGDNFLIKIHGDGLLAYALESTAGVEWSTDHTQE